MDACLLSSRPCGSYSQYNARCFLKKKLYATNHLRRETMPRLVHAALFHSTRESSMHEIVNEINLQNLLE